MNTSTGVPSTSPPAQSPFVWLWIRGNAAALMVLITAVSVVISGIWYLALTLFATKADIANLATKADIANLATKADIADVATRADVELVREANEQTAANLVGITAEQGRTLPLLIACVIEVGRSTERGSLRRGEIAAGSSPDPPFLPESCKMLRRRIQDDGL